MSVWLIDTGPLVALLVGDDVRHDWAVAQLKAAPPTVFTCDAVISEALFLLKREGYRSDDLFALAGAGFLQSSFDFNAEQGALAKMMRRYAERPMSFADACLVRMVENTPGVLIWTLDRHFHVYRQHGRQTIPLLTPD